MRRPRQLLPALLFALFVPVVPAAAASPSASPPSVAPASPGASPGSSLPPAPIAVIDVLGEVFRVELTTPGALDGARALLAGTATATIPVGSIVRGDPGPNAPWSWHIDPASLEWAEVAIEVCDGLPTDIEDDVLAIQQFCPWTARVRAIEGDPVAPPPLPPGEPTDLPLTASGGATADDRTFAQRVVLPASDLRLSWTTGAQIDLSISTCPARMVLFDTQGRPAGGSTDTDPDIAPYEDGVIDLIGLAAGEYDMFVSIDCAWTIRLERSTSSAS